MPKYRYKCNECDEEFSVLHITSDTEPECPKCQSHNVNKIIGNGIGIRFKGEGFYRTDHE